MRVGSSNVASVSPLDSPTLRFGPRSASPCFHPCALADPHLYPLFDRLSRAGIVAPLVTGSLLAISPSIPLWTSAAFFLASVGATVLLPFERAEDVARVPEGEYRKLDGR